MNHQREQTVLDTTCPTCQGVGILGTAPDTHERIYCDACVYGVELHVSDVKMKMNDAAWWLREHEPWRALSPHCFIATEAYLSGLVSEYDAARSLLDTLKYDETNRQPARLFEDV